MNEKRFDSKNAHNLDNPERLKWSPPEELLDRLPINSGDTVADIGAGTGYFALPIARRIGTKGTLYAVDVQQDMLEILNSKLDDIPAYSGVHLINGEASNTSLPDCSANLALLANVWHEVNSTEATAREMMRIVRKNGHVAILDWRPGVEQPPGPPLEHRISSDQICQTLENMGWQVTEAGPMWAYHSLVIATKKA